jgi:GMP synthase-like glutamine amidotransferase
MKIGILDCDHVDADLRADYGEYADMCQRLLLAAQPDLHFAVYSAVDGELPPHEHDCDGWLVTGSRASAYDDADWISALVERLRGFYRDGERVAGICFGHQLLAHCLGGRTQKAAAGWGMGLHRYRLDAQPSWMAPAADTFALYASHQDQVVELPPAAQRLAGSDFCPNAAFVIDDRVLGFQGHPEFTLGYERALLERRRAQLDPMTYSAANASLQHAPDTALVADWMLVFLRG